MEDEETQVVADAVEEGSSVRRATLIVNQHRMDTDQVSLTIGCVYYLIQRLMPKATKIKKRKQGETDKGSKWARARLNWIVQLMIRFGLASWMLTLQDLQEI